MVAAVSGFDWDDGNWPKCAKHGVSKAEIEYVLSNEPMVRPNRTSGDGETRFNAIGQTAKNRYLFIAFAIRARNGRTMIRPISARYMHRKEIKHHEKKAGT